MRHVARDLVERKVLGYERRRLQGRGRAGMLFFCCSLGRRGVTRKFSMISMDKPAGGSNLALIALVADGIK